MRMVPQLWNVIPREVHLAPHFMLFQQGSTLSPLMQSSVSPMVYLDTDGCKARMLERKWQKTVQCSSSITDFMECGPVKFLECLGTFSNMACKAMFKKTLGGML